MRGKGQEAIPNNNPGLSTSCVVGPDSSTPINYWTLRADSLGKTVQRKPDHFIMTVGRGRDATSALCDMQSWFLRPTSVLARVGKLSDE